MLKTSAIVGAGALFLPKNILAQGQSPNEKMNVACIGLGAQGGFQLSGMRNAKNDVNIVALCDVDDARAGGAYNGNPDAKKFYDFRQMFDDMEKSIDAVTVSTPDHTHYHPVMRALRAGKHVYCEKPLAHSVQEIRNITVTAAEKGVATQLGCQRHTHQNMHRVVELIKSGAIGDVTEVWSWVGGRRGMPSTSSMKAVDPPATLKWDLWLGPCPKDWAYSVNGSGKGMHAPYEWRFWWDFGTGETGNWSCHILDIPYWALDLKYPTRVSASPNDPAVDPDRTPVSMDVVLDYPARGTMPPLKLYWGQTDNPGCFAKYNIPKIGGTNNVFIGTKGILVCDFDKLKLFPEEQFKDFVYPEKTIPNSPGFHREWINACKGGIPATVNFAYSGPMAESAILANTAYRAGHKTFDWDAEKLIAKDCPEVQAAIKPEFRKGWEY